MSPTQKIYIAGHKGMVGSALLRALRARGFENLPTTTRAEVDHTRQAEVEAYLAEVRPDVMVIAAAKVGGIHANDTYPADFLYENLMIAANLIHGAFCAEVPRVLFLGSSCIYPKHAPQPMPEDCLLTSPLEPTNEAYAVAKIAGLKLCQHYRKQYGSLFHSAMPTNLYGPGDNYHPENSHVIPALLRRFHEAKIAAAPQVEIWGTGTPKREFLNVDDLADGCLRLLEEENPPDWVNLGAGEDIAIIDLAKLVAETVGYEGEIMTDPSKPDGTPRKLMDNSRMVALGWKPKISLSDGLKSAYTAFLSELGSGEVRSA